MVRCNTRRAQPITTCSGLKICAAVKSGVIRIALYAPRITRIIPLRHQSHHAR